LPTPRFLWRSSSVANQSTGQYEEFGIDSSGDLEYQDAGTKRVVPKVVMVTVDVNATSVDKHVFIAGDAYQVVAVKHIVSTGAAGATVDVKKCTGTTAPASGTTVVSAALALDATSNTTTTATLSSTAADLLLASGDRLSLDFTGTLTGLVGMVQLYLRRVSNT
jgi:hypothetical protein